MTTALAAIFVLGVLVFVHELGHFLVAKWAGIKVERFSLGFPPKMVGITIGETEYCISWLPLGGYVKMAGENPEDGESTGDPREFMSKSIGARAAVIVAGPLMNFIAAILAFSLVLMFWGRPTLDTEHVLIGPVLEGSPADSIGLRNGDVILAVDHETVATFEEMASRVQTRAGQSLELLWRRDGELYSAMITPKTDTLRDSAGADSVIVGRIGVGLGYTYEPVGVLASIVEGTKQSITVTATMFGFLGGLFSGDVSIKMVSGPVGIVRFAGTAAREGFDMLLNFMAILSVNLAILNVLPIPILDGGHLVFLAMEKLRGRPLTIRQRAIAQQVGFALLLLLIVTVTYHDILRLLTG
ncbi:MAG TPA: RIP metalloprotease RseP [candidate division Zixibacteria bacterium]